MINLSKLPLPITQGLVNPPPPDGIGPQALPLSYNFAAAASIKDELILQEMQGQLPQVQAVYINNRANANALTFTVDGTQIEMTVPAGAQAIFPCLATLPTRYTLTTTLADVTVPIAFLNIPMPYLVWTPGATTPANLAAIIALLTAIEINTADAVTELSLIESETNELADNLRGAYTDRSGAVAAANTWQVVAAANLARKKFFLTVDGGAVASIFIFIGAAPPANGTYTGAFELIPAQTWEETPPTSTDGIWIQSTSNNAAQKFTAIEM